MSNDFLIPEDLSDFGKHIAENIIKIASRSARNISGGGCKAFYSPESWEHRGESYGKNSLLIVVHDGGDLAPYFNYDYGKYIFINEMSESLHKLGVYAEQCTSWYSAIYAGW